jgi:two-component system, chemotaxis family, chemotaxis protein CheY
VSLVAEAPRQKALGERASWAGYCVDRAYVFTGPVEDENVIGHEQRCVLVIDDDPQVRVILSDALRAEGYCVATAENGDSGMAILDGGRVDAVILDLVMPVMDGWNFLAMRRSYALGTQIPVVIVSGSLVDGALAALQELGVYAWFAKPFDLPELLECIANIIEADQPDRRCWYR